jgi:flagellar M-ring protein FliF
LNWPPFWAAFFHSRASFECHKLEDSNQDAALQNQIQNLLQNLGALGFRRLSLVGGALVAMLGMIGMAAYVLNRPAFEVLYIGLEREDIAKVGMALSEAGFKFDVDSSGTTVSVASGTTAQARMLLAEKGLPASANAGYELFDNLGSLGLTSFMQEVTRIRALEGEIAKSIQTFNGIKAARVHIVMPDKTLFSSREQKPTASVLIRGDVERIGSSTNAIRHLVAAAIPGLAIDNVYVMDADGKLMAGGQNEQANGFASALDAQRDIERALEQKIGSSLGPQLGAFNFRVTVQAQIDTDKQATEETIYDPASRVERSVQVIKSEDSSSQQSDSKNPSVEQKLPQAATQSAAGPVNAESSEKREETTNFEISSKKVATERNGYRIQKLAIAIIVNKAKLVEVLGQNAQPSDVDARVIELQKIASTAAGLDETRGDRISISALEFVQEALEPPVPSGFFESVRPFIGTAANSIAFIVVALLLIFLGIRPLTVALSRPLQSDAIIPANVTLGITSPVNAAAPPQAQQISENTAIGHNSGNGQLGSQPSERLRKLAQADPEKAVNVIRGWLAEEAA